MDKLLTENHLATDSANNARVTELRHLHQVENRPAANRLLPGEESQNFWILVDKLLNDFHRLSRRGQNQRIDIGQLHANLYLD